MQKKNQSQSHQFEKLGSNNQIPLFNYGIHTKICTCMNNNLITGIQYASTQ